MSGCYKNAVRVMQESSDELGARWYDAYNGSDANVDCKHIGISVYFKKRNIYHQKIVVFHTKHFRSDFSFTLLDIFIACINFSL